MPDGIELDGMAKLSLQIGRLGDDLRESEERRRRELTPQFFKQSNSAICPTPTAAFAIGLGGPTVGHFWEVRGVVVGGLAWNTAAAGECQLYISALASAQVAQLQSLSDLFDSTTSAGGGLPSTAFYSGGQLILQPSDKLVAVVTGGTAGQAYTGCLRALVYPTTAMRSFVEA